MQSADVKKVLKETDTEETIRIRLTNVGNELKNSLVSKITDFCFLISDRQCRVNSRCSQLQQIVLETLQPADFLNQLPSSNAHPSTTTTSRSTSMYTELGEIF